MKRLLFLSFSLFIVFSCYAQKPEWITEKMDPTNETYLYMRESGYGEAELNARSAAITRVVNMTRLRLGQEYDMNAIKQVLDNNKMDFDKAKAKEKILELTKGQVSVQKGYYDRTEKRYWVLCAVQKKKDIPMNLGKEDAEENQPAIVDNPATDQPTENTKENAVVAEQTNNSKTPKTPKGINEPGQDRPKPKPRPGKPVKRKKIWWQSAIVPGLAQMQRGGVAEGVVTLAGEAALIGGGVYSHYHAQKQLDIMKTTQLPSEFNAAQKAYKTDKVINISCYAGAAVLYAFNLYRAYALDSSRYYFAATPTVISFDGELAMGLSFTYNF